MNLVIKIGSSVVVADDGQLRRDWITTLAEDVHAFATRGVRVTLVSSGAVAMGRDGAHGRLSLHEKQAFAAIGQVRLASAWRAAFERVGLGMGQILLTPSDTEHRRRHLNARATLEALHDHGAIPVINENDTVATEELRYGDNDQLAARVTQMIGADTLLLLSDVPGLMRDAIRPDSIIDWVEQIDDEVLSLAVASRSGLGTGGMRSKLEAARRATRAGATTIIASGQTATPLRSLLQGGAASVFGAQTDPGSARRRWIAGMLNRDATVTVDVGAAAALAAGKSLLPVGVLRIDGAFDVGACLGIQNEQGHEIGVGLARISRELVDPGRDDSEPRTSSQPLVHRDDLVMHPEHMP